MNNISTIILFCVVLLLGGYAEYKECELERAKHALELSYYIMWNNAVLDMDGSDQMEEYLSIYCEMQNQ